MSKPSLRKSLSLSGLLTTIRNCFLKIPDSKPRSDIPLVDHLMSGLAVFGLKYPSLLQFDRDQNTATLRANLKNLYGISQAPCDTWLRERLDAVDPGHLRRAYRQLFGTLQRGKGLEGFTWWNDHYLLSIDGTGYFSSPSVHCEQCCEKRHRDGRTTWYHQMLGAVLVHPDCREVFPLAPEPIVKQDGTNKNDCERNAGKRLLTDIRREHPHLKMIVIEDGLASNGPHIRHLKNLNYRFILGAKSTDHPFLFDWVESRSNSREHHQIDAAGVKHRFRYLNDAPLNDTHFDLSVNFLEYWETNPSGKTRYFSWVTDIPITESNLIPLMRGARARWKIENETFNTLKNQGYHFEHNFGHGNRYLTTVLMHLMMLTFLIDQIQQRCCSLFQRGIKKMGSKSRFWRKLRERFNSFLVPDWEVLYGSLAYELRPVVIAYDTS